MRTIVTRNRSFMTMLATCAAISLSNVAFGEQRVDSELVEFIISQNELTKSKYKSIYYKAEQEVIRRTGGEASTDREVQEELTTIAERIQGLNRNISVVTHDSTEANSSNINGLAVVLNNEYLAAGITAVGQRMPTYVYLHEDPSALSSKSARYSMMINAYNPLAYAFGAGSSNSLRELVELENWSVMVDEVEANDSNSQQFRLLFFDSNSPLKGAVPHYEFVTDSNTGFLVTKMVVRSKGGSVWMVRTTKYKPTVDSDGQEFHFPDESAELRYGSWSDELTPTSATLTKRLKVLEVELNENIDESYFELPAVDGAERELPGPFITWNRQGTVGSYMWENGELVSANSR